MKKLILCSMMLMFCFTQVKAAEDEAKASTISAYVSLGDPMVLNLSGPKRLTFLQISADVLVSDSDAEATIKTHVPALIADLSGSRDVSEILFSSILVQ